MRKARALREASEYHQRRKLAASVATAGDTGAIGRHLTEASHALLLRLAKGTSASVLRQASVHRSSVKAVCLFAGQIRNVDQVDSAKLCTNPAHVGDQVIRKALAYPMSRRAVCISSPPGVDSRELCANVATAAPRFCSPT